MVPNTLHFVAVLLLLGTGGSNSRRVKEIQIQPRISESKVPILKFGEVPTNRVLPVDQLTDEDYEDVQDEEDKDKNAGQREYCAHLFRSDLKKTLRKVRKGRQDDSQDEQDDSLISTYLGFNPMKAMGPMMSLWGSVSARNVTGIDENYKKLPTAVKSEVTEIISVFNEMVKAFIELESK